MRLITCLESCLANSKCSIILVIIIIVLVISIIINISYGNNFLPSHATATQLYPVKSRRKGGREGDLILNRVAPEGCHWPVGQ